METKFNPKEKNSQLRCFWYKGFTTLVSIKDGEDTIQVLITAPSRAALETAFTKMMYSPLEMDKVKITLSGSPNGFQIIEDDDIPF